ncbi:MAG: methylenetetrahydrofolate reductase C-terminal domain-containing protein, partial [Ardenticatenia bacterium]|nr:methylenetetrahydrofolate reductase C-terminal domain-containing protein [Ardenticatenia bacterium]
MTNKAWHVDWLAFDLGGKMLGGTPQRPRPAFYVPARQRLRDRLLSRVERRVKRTLYNCQSCGNCLLYETAFICPMTCSRGLRNGPCRGSTRDCCFVDQTRACTWFRIYQRAERHNALDRLLEINAPRDHQLADSGISPRSDGAEPERSQGPPLPDLIRNWVRLKPDSEGFRADQRQPSWGQGDSRYQPPAYAEPLSTL